MRVHAVLRVVWVVCGGLLAGLGAVSLAAHLAPDLALAPRATAAALVSKLAGGAVSPLALEVVLAGPVGRFALLPLGAGMLVVPRLLRRRRTEGEGEEPEGAAAAEPGLGFRARRRIRRQARRLAAEAGPVAAAELLLDAGLLDDAAALFLEAGERVRAAEVRAEQGRPLEAAALYREAGRLETAGQLFAREGEPIAAAECFAEAGCHGLAAEAYEAGGNHAAAGRHYLEAGYLRHAARAFVRARDWLPAAEAIEAVVGEESRRARGNARREKELSILVQKGARLFEEAGEPGRARDLLVRGGRLAEAAEVAVRQGHFEEAAELFLRAGDAPRAADAYRKQGRPDEAARVLGIYYRDRDDPEAAARLLEEAGEHADAADLYRKLERPAEAALCYERAGDMAQAAEMFRCAGELLRASECYARAGAFGEAAVCCQEAGDAAREAEYREQAEDFLGAGRLYRELERGEDAIRVLQRVPAESPEAAEAAALLGELFAARGLASLAEKKLREALGDAEPAPERLPAWYALAGLLEERGELREAVSIYQKILACDYHFRDVEQRCSVLQDRLRLERSEVPSGDGGDTAPTCMPGRYQVESELGRGGMGIVYRARDTVLDRIVAYKVLPDSLRENPQALRNFLREAKSAAQLNHPNIVTVYDAGEQDGRYYIAMEYVDGTTLKAILRKRKVIAPAGVLRVLVQMCEALAYAHDKKIVHRDIKTANTMWTRDRKAKIMDFGLAKVVEEVRNHTTIVSGTPYYMSPEQTLGRNVDHRTDIYSLGVTLFELATGQLPFKDGNVPYHHVHTPPPDPLSVNPRLPPLLARIITRCLQKSPDQRYQSARQILAEIRAARAARRS